MHAKATTPDGTILAEADDFQTVEGNIYFPPSSLKDKSEHFKDSTKHAQCPWKGQSSYYDVVAGGKTLHNAAWYYPQPLEKAQHIKDHVAFDKSQVHVEHGGKGGEHHGMMDKVKHMFKS